MNTTKALVYHQNGAPAEVLRLEEQPLRELANNEALVEMQFAPINPVDLNVIEGGYPARPPLPAIGGVEGVGKIIALGEIGKTAATNEKFKIGGHILLAHHHGAWAQHGIFAISDLIPLPEEFANDDLPQAAMLKINPATAWRMLHDFTALKSEDWVLQNAANSGVGRAVIQIAKALQLKTVNIVRRPELIDELKADGADIVISETETGDLAKQIAEETGNAKIHLALNAVGGESALSLANALAPGGTHVTYGAMARKPVRIPNGLLIFKDLRFRGFWVTHWYQTASREMRDGMLAQLFDLASRHILHSPIEKTYALSEVKAAIEHAQQNRRAGKILFDLQA